MELRLLPFMLALTVNALVPQARTAEPIHLYTFLAPPYQTLVGTVRGEPTISGLTVDTVTCATRLAGWSPVIKLAPQNRALYALQRNSVDGYFTSYPFQRLDQSSVRSDPVALEKWYFYSHSGDIDRQTARIGVVSGSNEHAWLEENGYRVFLAVSSARQLLALLDRQRIDLALMDSRVMKALINDSAAPGSSDLHRTFVSYTSLHLYLSQAFNSRHPGFLDAFNTYLSDCLDGQFDLDEQERSALSELATQLIGELTSRLDIQQMIRSGYRIDSLAEVLRQDSLWQALAPRQHSELAENIARQPTSRQLADFQSEHDGLITEIMVTNDMGAVVAMSQLTSDYWQGDEDKFRKLAGASEGDLRISPIRYDQSTASFQVSVSTPILSAGSSTLEGVLVIGLDIGKALEAPRP